MTRWSIRVGTRPALPRWMTTVYMFLHRNAADPTAYFTIPPNRVVEFVDKTSLPLKVSLDPLGEIEKGFGGLKFVPTSFVIDRRGYIARRIDGEIQFGALHSLIEAKLKEPAPGR